MVADTKPQQMKQEADSYEERETRSSLLIIDLDTEKEEESETFHNSLDE